MTRLRHNILGRTQNCVECGAVATNYCGNVTKSDGHVIAGWCREHIDLDKVTGESQPPGACHGEWTEKMGLKDTNT